MKKQAFLLLASMFGAMAPAEDVRGGTMVDHQENDGHASRELLGMTMDAQRILEESFQSVTAILKTMFEREGRPLLVEPFVVQNDWAIAGWQQDGRGGRALLKKGPHGWRLNLLSGDGIKDAASLESIGLSTSDAAQLSASLLTEEEKLDPKTIALFSASAGTIVIARNEGDAGKGGHEGHAK